MVGCQKGEEVAEEATSDELVPLDLKNAHGSWFEGLLTEDTTGLNKFLSEDVTLGFGDSVMPRARFLSLLQSGDLVYETAEHEVVGFHIHGNTAVVTGRSNLVYRFKGKEDLEHLAYTAVYIRADGEWEMAAWQSADIDEKAELEAIKIQAEVEVDKEAINAWYERYVANNNAGDFDSFGTFWTEDIVWLPPDAPVVIGKEAILDYARPFFELYSIHQEITVEEITVSGKIAFVRHIATEKYSPKEEGESIESNGKGIFIFQRQNDGTWICTHAIWNSNNPPPKEE
jgi:uncharacterized protein (TIGR02246 family)